MPLLQALWLISKIWLNPSSARGSRDAPITLEIEFYPLTVVPNYGVIVGLTSQRIQLNPSESTFRLQSGVCYHPVSCVPST